MYDRAFNEIKKIYDRLQDEESKDIFCNRMMLNITGDWNYARYIVKHYLRGYKADKIFTGLKDNLLELKLNRDEEYIIYGAGMFGKQACDILNAWKMKICAFCDADREKQKQKYLDYSVISPEQLKDFPDAKILMAVWGQSRNIKSSLQKIGIEDIRIIDCFPVENYVDKNQYFDEEIIKFTDNEVFVDCGCFDLETTEIFIDKCPDYKKVICFEPDEVNKSVIENKIKKQSLDRVELYPYGVWNERDVLYFGGNGSSAQIASTGEQRIQVITIDEVIKEKVTFIKMDIEGAEWNALEGTKKIIVRDKPKLAICVYHKPEDIVSIPQYLLELVPEYKFYLRHYSNFFATETVLYAVI